MIFTSIFSFALIKAIFIFLDPLKKKMKKQALWSSGKEYRWEELNDWRNCESSLLPSVKNFIAVFQMRFFGIKLGKFKVKIYLVRLWGVQKNEIDDSFMFKNFQNFFLKKFFWGFFSCEKIRKKFCQKYFLRKKFFKIWNNFQYSRRILGSSFCWKLPILDHIIK